MNCKNFGEHFASHTAPSSSQKFLRGLLLGVHFCLEQISLCKYSYWLLQYLKALLCLSGPKRQRVAHMAVDPCDNLDTDSGTGNFKTGFQTI